eukprot:TRINITY_DN18268_c0_g1_i1.p1 TRINITY_DN18268_c0_g1~~TRINITY_DN18268_c0_g1_i1.p1  ORF type:complete len:656 (-),score=100.11 TRINITY_DN18268_c0_g1_i1:975-2906(-)
MSEEQVFRAVLEEARAAKAAFAATAAAADSPRSTASAPRLGNNPDQLLKQEVHRTPVVSRSQGVGAVEDKRGEQEALAGANSSGRRHRSDHSDRRTDPATSLPSDRYSLADDASFASMSSRASSQDFASSVSFSGRSHDTDGHRDRERRSESGATGPLLSANALSLRDPSFSFSSAVPTSPPWAGGPAEQNRQGPPSLSDDFGGSVTSSPRIASREESFDSQYRPLSSSNSQPHLPALTSPTSSTQSSPHERPSCFYVSPSPSSTSNSTAGGRQLVDEFSHQDASQGARSVSRMPSDEDALRHGTAVNQIEQAQRSLSQQSQPPSLVMSSPGTSRQVSPVENLLWAQPFQTDTAVSVFEGQDLAKALSTGDSEEKLHAAATVRQLAKSSQVNRVVFGRAGVIPPLLSLMASPGKEESSLAAFALLNLSLCDENKDRLVELNAIPSLVDVLKGGCELAREGATATIFSLSVSDANKLRIVEAGALPYLVDVLVSGTSRAKKDCVGALFNLSLLPANKALVVQARALKPLVYIIRKGRQVFGDSMVEKAVAILSNLSFILHGRMGIAANKGLPVLVQTLNSGSPKAKEDAAACLLRLSVCKEEGARVLLMRDLLLGPLRRMERAEDTTGRGRAKAIALIEQLEGV